MKLIEDARHWWRMWSVRYAALAVAAVSFLFERIVENPGLILAVVGFAREGYQLPIILALIALGFGVPTLLRVLDQPSCKGTRDGDG